MTLVLDAGALIAYERGDHVTGARVKHALEVGDVPVTHGGIVGQVWRGGARQARVATLLAGLRISALDEAAGRAAGELLARTRTTDVIDAALVQLARDGDTLLTSDPHDLSRLVRAAGLDVDILEVH